VFFCKRDKLYTNPSFVVGFLNPCFNPLYLKVYSDTKPIFIVKVTPDKIGTNMAQKYVYEKYCYDSSGPEFLHSGADFSGVARLKKQCKFGPRTTPFEPRIGSFQKPQFFQF